MAIAISEDKQLLCDESERPDSKYSVQWFLNESGKRMALGGRDLHCLCDPTVSFGFLVCKMGVRASTLPHGEHWVQQMKSSQLIACP